jgi:hypothetical protein
MARLSKVTLNPNHDYIRHLYDYSIRGLPPWMDDIIMGACYTSAGISKGKLNVNPALVKAAIFLPAISTDSCLNIYSLEPISLRTAQRVAKAARFALEGIEMYIQRQREDEVMKVSWQMEKEFLSSYYTGKESKYYSPSAQKLPYEITKLREQGKYLEYGNAVREFRLSN